MALPTPAAGSVAVVTGASSGIGRELARQLAQQGHDLVLVARRRERLEQLAAEVQERWGRRAQTVVCDVSDAAAREALVQEVEAASIVSVLVLCAGFGVGGELTTQAPDRLQLMLRTNVEGVVMLSRAFAPGMQRRGDGAILIVSSIAGNGPVPGFGVYAATKAAITSFGEMLHEELRDSGVSVTTVCPGETTTEFVETAGVQAASDGTPDFTKMQPEDVARIALAGLARGRRKVVPGAPQRVFGAIGRHAPRGLWLRAARRMMSA